MSITDNFGFYAILSSPIRGYEYCAQCIVDAGVKCLQLRIKNTPRDAIIAIAEKIRRITEGSQTLFIINDDPVLAQACNADGVHIGQDDMPYETVRKLVGSQLQIGISTHNPDQTIAACSQKPDYIGVGPVFPTPTKKKPDPAIGISGMKTMLSKATVPAVAIGGINCANLHEVIEAGARNFCMVRELTQSENPQKILQNIIRISQKYYSS